MKVILTESQLKRLVSKSLIKEDEGMENESPKFPYNAEDVVDWDLNGNELIIAFGDNEEYDEFDVDYYVSYYSPAEPQTYDYPGSGEEIEISIRKVKQLKPVEKDIPVKYFESFMEHLGIFSDLYEKMQDIEMERKNDSYDEPDYDEDRPLRGRDLDKEWGGMEF